MKFLMKLFHHRLTIPPNPNVCRRLNGQKSLARSSGFNDVKCIRHGMDGADEGIKLQHSGSVRLRDRCECYGFLPALTGTAQFLFRWEGMIKIRAAKS